MRASLAVVPQLSDSLRPDISWIKKHVPVLEVAKALGLRIRRGRSKCWRPENHTHGDAEPSLHFHERRNRVRCFVCDMRGGHSCVDLVIGVLCVDVGEAVRWIAERFTVPGVKPGRPVGQAMSTPQPYRVGDSELDILVRSGMFGQLDPAASLILITLMVFRDSESGLTRLSYRAIQRYSGVASSASVARALKQLARLRAIEVHRGARIGATRECSGYRVTLDDPKFYELCNGVCRIGRDQIAKERSYRQELRSQREKKSSDSRAKKQSHPRIVETNAEPALNTTEAGGLRPPDPPRAFSLQGQENAQERTSTCEGLNLSSLGEVISNKALHGVMREIGFSGEISDSEALRRQVLRRQAEEIKAKYLDGVAQ